MFSITEDDVGIVAYELSEICRTMSFIFPVPFLVTLLYLPSFDLFYIMRKFFVFMAPAIASYGLYLLLRRMRNDAQPRTRHTMMTVAVVWFFIAVLGALPYLLSGVLGPLDALFESMSGWTTTGLTMIPNPELIDKDIIFYRAYTQWIGGIGIIVLALVVFLRRGTVAMDYYAAEVGDQRIRPRLASTISETWKIYLVYTIAFIILMYVAGMDPFDAMVHTFSALATAGFSSYSDSLGHFSTYPNGMMIQLVVAVCMIFGSVSFLLHFRLFEGDYWKLLDNIEFKYFMKFLAASTLIVFAYFYLSNPADPARTFVDSFVQMASALSTTGLQTVNLTRWPDLPLTIMIILMVLGGLYGSTCGGLKMLRVVLIFKVIEYGVKKMMLPKTAVIRIKIAGRHIDWNAVVSVFGFTSLYVATGVSCALVLMLFGFPGMQAMFVAACALGNVGFSGVPASLWYGNLHYMAKIALILVMWLGRVEIFPALVLLSSLRRRKKTGGFYE
jgi:trk system potassium uptake protein TrkH